VYLRFNVALDGAVVFLELRDTVVPVNRHSQSISNEEAEKGSLLALGKGEGRSGFHECDFEESEE
jgi:hypothetical protein